MRLIDKKRMSNNVKTIERMFFEWCLDHGLARHNDGGDGVALGGDRGGVRLGGGCNTNGKAGLGDNGQRDASAGDGVHVGVVLAGGDENLVGGDGGASKSVRVEGTAGEGGVDGSESTHDEPSSGDDTDDVPLADVALVLVDHSGQDTDVEDAESNQELDVATESEPVSVVADGVGARGVTSDTSDGSELVEQQAGDNSEGGNTGSDGAQNKASRGVILSSVVVVRVEVVEVVVAGTTDGSEKETTTDSQKSETSEEASARQHAENQHESKDVLSDRATKINKVSKPGDQRGERHQDGSSDEQDETVARRVVVSSITLDGNGVTDKEDDRTDEEQPSKDVGHQVDRLQLVHILPQGGIVGVVGGRVGGSTVAVLLQRYGVRHRGSFNISRNNTNK